jgi:FKBP-type peptidyl-prolyl cis-trans isomerase
MLAFRASSPCVGGGLRWSLMLLMPWLLAACASDAQPTVTTLQIKDVREGDGALASPGRRVVVHYTGEFLDGREFDSSRPRGEPFEFRLGGEGVIAGWNEGIKGMRVGGVRELTIPASMAYGARGRGEIPPNTPLFFEVELVDVR